MCTHTLHKLHVLTHVQVDVIYPASPFFLWTAPHTLQLLLKPILEYSINHTKEYGYNIPYNLNWAPHDLGRWPRTLK